MNNELIFVIRFHYVVGAQEYPFLGGEETLSAEIEAEEDVTTHVLDDSLLTTGKIINDSGPDVCLEQLFRTFPV